MARDEEAEDEEDKVGGHVPHEEDGDPLQGVRVRLSCTCSTIALEKREKATSLLMRMKNIKKLLMRKCPKTERRILVLKSSVARKNSHGVAH